MKSLMFKILIALVLISTLVLIWNLYNNNKIQIENEKQMNTKIISLFDEALATNTSAVKEIQKPNLNIESATIIMKNLADAFAIILKKVDALMVKYPKLNNHNNYSIKFKINIKNFLRSAKELEHAMQTIPLSYRKNKNYFQEWSRYSRIIRRF